MRALPVVLLLALASGFAVRAPAAAPATLADLERVVADQERRIDELTGQLGELAAEVRRGRSR